MALKNHKAVLGMSAAAVALVAGGFAWALVALQMKGAGPFILHFNDIQGITQLGGAGDLASAGIIAGIGVLINGIVAFELDRRDRVLGKIMAGITLAASILLFIACAAILNVN